MREFFGDATPLRIAFWVSVILFWVLFIIQTGVYAVVGFVLLAGLMVFAYRRAKKRREDPEWEQPPQPRWLRPVVIPLLILLLISLVSSEPGDMETLDWLIDGVLVVQLVW